MDSICQSCPLLFYGACFSDFLSAIYRLVGRSPLFFVAQIFGFSLLGMVNYLEHYGMERKEIGIRDLRASIVISSWQLPLGSLVFFTLSIASDYSDHHRRELLHKRYQGIKFL